MTEQLDAKFMAVVMTQEGFMKWAEGKSIQITDVKPEFRDAVGNNFVHTADVDVRSLAKEAHDA